MTRGSAFGRGYDKTAPSGGRYDGKCFYFMQKKMEIVAERKSCYRAAGGFHPKLGTSDTIMRAPPELGGDARTPVKCSSTVKLKLLRCTGCGCRTVYKGKKIWSLVKMQLDHALNAITINGKKKVMPHCQPWFIYIDTMIRNMVGKVRREMVGKAAKRCAAHMNKRPTKQSKRAVSTRMSKSKMASTTAKKVDPLTKVTTKKNGYGYGAYGYGSYGGSKSKKSGYGYGK